MHKKYKVEKLEELRKKMGKENIKTITSSPFLYVTGREEGEREHYCALEYNSFFDEFLLIDLEEEVENNLLQNTEDLVVDDEIIDELLDKSTKIIYTICK